MVQSFPQSVVCAALNFRGTLKAMDRAFHSDPYKQPPRAPVLYWKTFNTLNGDGGDIFCPDGVGELRMGATIGIVIGRAACRVRVENALDYVDGYCALNDVSVPHASYYRPAIKERCFDGSLVMGDVVPAQAIQNPNALDICVVVNRETVCENTTANLVRTVQQLLADVTEFMTLVAGDVLAVGEPDNAPLARPGDEVMVEIAGLGKLTNRIRAEIK